MVSSLIWSNGAARIHQMQQKCWYCYGVQTYTGMRGVGGNACTALPSTGTPVRPPQHAPVRWHKGLSLCSRAAGAQICPAGILAEGRGLSWMRSSLVP